MIITRAPLRISLGGGGTDLPSYYCRYGGLVVSAAINKYVFINVNKPAVDPYIRLKFSNSETVHRVDQIQHSLFREALRFIGINKNIEIASMADIASGTGLGSSGSFLAALLLALHTYKKEQAVPQVLAEEACKVEIEMAKKPVGKQDQYIATFGGLSCFEINQDGQVNVAPLRMSAEAIDELENNLLIFFTGISRTSHEILNKQNRDTNKGVSQVIESLHVTKEIGREVKRALEAGEIEKFGELLDFHWQNKKKRAKDITNPQIDYWYQLAKDNGAIGGKLMGPGGCGFFMFCCQNSHKNQVRKVLTKEGLLELPFRFDTEGTKVLVNFAGG